MALSAQTNSIFGDSAYFLEFMKSISDCETFGCLETYLISTLEKFGIKRFAYHHIPSLGAIDVASFNVLNYGFPDAIITNFNEEQLHKVDPTLRIVMRQSQPIWWGEIVFPKKLKPEEEAFIEDMIAQDFGEGITFPVFGPHGRNGFFSAGFGPTRPDYSQYDINLIQMFYQVAHHRYSELLMNGADKHQPLSNRECEILSWVARGKSNAVIAEILGLQNSSVVTYLERAFDKLGTNNRVTATLRAMAIGELEI